MLKKAITYTNPFTDQEVTEEHYFHISKADLVEMQMESLKEPEIKDPATGEVIEGFRAKLQRIINSQDGKELMIVVKDLIRRSYGKKNGDNFLKNNEIRDEFEQSEAYSQLFFELCTDAEAQATFMNGVIPGNLSAEVIKLQASNGSVETDPTGLRTPEMTTRVLSMAQAAELDPDELKSGLVAGRYKLS